MNKFKKPRNPAVSLEGTVAVGGPVLSGILAELPLTGDYESLAAVGPDPVNKAYVVTAMRTTYIVHRYRGHTMDNRWGWAAVPVSGEFGAKAVYADTLKRLTWELGVAPPLETT